jgi:dTDP-4-amino-4,6-dideoxygalactose transaminase
MIRCKERSKLIGFLKDKGIETSIHYPAALPNLPAYQYLNHSPSDFPVASRLQDEILSLPMYPELSEEQIQLVADSIRQFYKKLSLKK